MLCGAGAAMVEVVVGDAAPAKVGVGEVETDGSDVDVGAGAARCGSIGVDDPHAPTMTANNAAPKSLVKCMVLGGSSGQGGERGHLRAGHR